MKKQSAGEFSRAISGQWTKSEKRSAASRAIMQANRLAHTTIKAFIQNQKMK